MSKNVKHHQISEIVRGLSESKVVNLDASLRDLIEPVGTVIARGGDEVSLHILCCNEYALVTGLQAERMPDIEDIAASISKVLTAHQGK